jgi:cellobiose-specific phosphotransferase system component IIA
VVVAVVFTVTVAVAGDAPRVIVDALHVAKAGRPEQAKAMFPEKPATPVRVSG